MASAKTVRITHRKPHSAWGPGKEPQSVRDAYDAQWSKEKAGRDAAKKDGK